MVALVISGLKKYKSVSKCIRCLLSWSTKLKYISNKNESPMFHSTLMLQSNIAAANVYALASAPPKPVYKKSHDFTNADIGSRVTESKSCFAINTLNETNYLHICPIQTCQRKCKGLAGLKSHMRIRDN